MEYFDVYNIKGNKLNKQVKRGTPLNKDEYFMIVHVWIENNQGQFLIQKRAKKSDPNPFQWATTTGSALAGEKAIDTAIRETKEELGLMLNKQTLKQLGIITSTRAKYQTITHVFHTKLQVSLDELRLDKDEVLDVTWATLSEIKTMIKNNTFWDYPYLLNEPDYFSLLERRR